MPTQIEEEGIKETVIPQQGTLKGVSVGFYDRDINEVFMRYLALENALLDSDVLLVQKEAEKIAGIDAAILGKQMQATAKLMSLTKANNKQRDFFVTLTQEMEKLIVASKIEYGTVYKHFCDTALDGVGAFWLSVEKTSKNPYKTNSSVDCKVTTELLNLGL